MCRYGHGGKMKGVAMTDGKELLPEELLHQVEEAARAQNREPAELVTDAVRKYLDEQSWVKYVERNEAKTRKAGISEADVDRLLSEARSETRR
jgi:metal-responsive CopG/Arc/MetJ family transcriptional regulator